MAIKKRLAQNAKVYIDLLLKLIIIHNLQNVKDMEISIKVNTILATKNKTRWQINTRANINLFRLTNILSLLNLNL